MSLEENFEGSVPQTLTSIQAFYNWFAEQDSSNGYRGHANLEWALDPSIHRNPNSKRDRPWSTSDMEAEEVENLELFCDRAKDYLPEIARRYLDDGSQLNKFAVMQHYGVRTRLLDWTTHPGVAAYFSTLGDENIDGAIWRIHRQELVDFVDPQWERWGISRDSSGQIDLNQFLEHKQKPLLTMVNYRLPFPRMSAQSGFFTLSNTLGVKHDGVFLELEGLFDKVIIARTLKRDLRDHLELWRMDATNLMHAEADRIGHEISFCRKFDVNLRDFHTSG